MKKSVIVRKPKTQRYGIYGISAFLMAMLTLVIMAFQSGFALLLYVPFLALILPLVLYYKTWKIVFDSDGIRKTVFFGKPKCYAYHQLKEVVKGYSYTEYGFIRMVFINGKTMRFRLEDENAGKAEAVLQRHHSFKVLPLS